jgi:hypothetical protein
MKKPTTRTPTVPASGPGSNTGHGHVWERPDGTKAPCGGIVGCSFCQRDLGMYGRRVETENVTPLRSAKTYVARLSEIRTDGLVFKSAGTLDGLVDFAVQSGGRDSITYSLSIEGAAALARALLETVKDVRENCLYDRDALLAKREETKP